MHECHACMHLWQKEIELFFYVMDVILVLWGIKHWREKKTLYFQCFFMIRSSFSLPINCILLLHHRYLKSYFSLTWLKEWILRSENFTDNIGSVLGILTATLCFLLNTSNGFSRPFEHAISPLCFFVENTYVIKNASSLHHRPSK